MTRLSNDFRKSMATESECSSLLSRIPPRQPRSCRSHRARPRDAALAGPAIVFKYLACLEPARFCGTSSRPDDDPGLTLIPDSH
jgi:hypothetical protein